RLDLLPPSEALNVELRCWNVELSCLSVELARSGELGEDGDGAGGYFGEAGVADGDDVVEGGPLGGGGGADGAAVVLCGPFGQQGVGGAGVEKGGQEHGGVAALGGGLAGAHVCLGVEPEDGDTGWGWAGGVWGEFAAGDLQAGDLFGGAGDAVGD